MDLDTSWTVLVVGSVVFLSVGFVIVFYLLQGESPNCMPPLSRPHTGDMGISPAPADLTVRNCFGSATVPANRLINTLQKYGLQGKYTPLVLTYSVILCKHEEALMGGCTNVEEALQKVLVLGGSPKSASGATQLSYYTLVPKTPSNTTDFLVASMDIISNSMAALVNEDTISEEDRRAVRGYNYEFCRNYIDAINKVCQPKQ